MKLRLKKRCQILRLKKLAILLNPRSTFKTIPKDQQLHWWMTKLHRWSYMTYAILVYLYRIWVESEIHGMISFIFISTELGSGDRHLFSLGCNHIPFVEFDHFLSLRLREALDEDMVANCRHWDADKPHPFTPPTYQTCTKVVADIDTNLDVLSYEIWFVRTLELVKFEKLRVHFAAALEIWPFFSVWPSIIY